MVTMTRGVQLCEIVVALALLLLGVAVLMFTHTAADAAKDYERQQVQVYGASYVESAHLCFLSRSASATRPGAATFTRECGSRTMSSVTLGVLPCWVTSLQTSASAMSDSSRAPWTRPTV